MGFHAKHDKHHRKHISSSESCASTCTTSSTDSVLCGSQFPAAPLEKTLKSLRFGRRGSASCLSNEMLWQSSLPLLAMVEEIADDPAQQLDLDQWHHCTIKTKTTSSVDWYELETKDRFAVLATVRIPCHVYEVVDLLATSETHPLMRAMTALYPGCFANASVLHAFRPSEQANDHIARPIDIDPSKLSTVSVKSTTLLKPERLFKAKKTEVTTCFVDCMEQSVDHERAIYVFQNLDRNCHEHLIRSHSLLKAVHQYAGGFYLTQDTRTQTLKVVFYGSCSTSARLDVGKWWLTRVAHGLQRLEPIVLRRRLGFQTFLRPSCVEDSGIRPKQCRDCRQVFGTNWFQWRHRAFLCQLCGFLVCAKCSRMYEVESMVSQLIRYHRVCTRCMETLRECVFQHDSMHHLRAACVVSIDEATINEAEKTEKTTPSDERWSDLTTYSVFAGAKSQVEPLPVALAHQEEDSVSDSDSVDSFWGVEDQPSNQNKMEKYHTTAELDREFLQLTDELGGQRVAVDRLSVDDCRFNESDGYRSYKMDYQPQKKFQTPPIPPTEAKRLANIDALQLLNKDAIDCNALNAVCAIAAREMDCPMSCISTITADTSHVIANFNLEVPSTGVPRDQSICTYTITSNEPFLVRDTCRDLRFKGFIGALRFYVGFPVTAPDGSVVATLCTIDTDPRTNISTTQYAKMTKLASIVSDLLAQNAKKQANIA